MKAIKGRVNDPVFTSIATGVYEARLAGYELKIIKRANAEWVAQVKDTGKVLAVAESRVKVLKDAYYSVMYEESQRLDWVLANQPYREYEEGNHPRDKKTQEQASVSPLIKSVEQVEQISALPVIEQIRQAREQAKPKRGRPRKDSKVTSINDAKYQTRVEQARKEAEEKRQRAERWKQVDGERVIERLQYISSHYEIRISKNGGGAYWFKFSDKKNAHGRIMEEHYGAFQNELKAFEDILVKENVIDADTVSQKANEWDERYGLVERMKSNA